MKITVNEVQPKTRLDQYLVDHLEGFSRSALQKQIKQGLILVNGERVSVHHFLHANDVIEINQAEQAPLPPMPTIEVLAEGDGYIVVNKPAGLLTHHAQGSKEVRALTDWIETKHPECKTIGDAHRPGIVHRLDKDTSGIMIIATNEAMFESLKAQFHDRLIHKTYTALVHGQLPHRTGIINKPIGRSAKHGRMAARTKKESENDRDALTFYQVEHEYQKYSLVTAWPKTGRTHQIRVHLQSQGTPIVGDILYTIHAQKEQVDLGRVFLHASKLCFTDLQGERVMVESTLPQDLKDFLTTLS